MPFFAPDLPDASIGALPVLLQEVQQRTLERPGRLGLLQPCGARTVQCDHDLAEDVPLALFVRGVTHANRGGAPVAGQFGDVVLVQSSFSADAVHDLHIARGAGDGPQQPPAPLLRLGPIPVGQQHADRESGIPEPHIPVVPVPAAALGFRADSWSPPLRCLRCPHRSALAVRATTVAPARRRGSAACCGRPNRATSRSSHRGRHPHRAAGADHDETDTR